ncbi:eukaryotic translation initiation factor 4E-binding protein [Lutzomyia longipalpis]|uniref:Putative eukaryotic translation initiation factor corethrella appendiculata n=1 Tax=Lutzomyia longipalpis TaxID=7200 RepID=A0A1B0CR12_LUTLO|nr:eukaryotic translation initiation factor 4E-binding protein [Lutzomyia longipalpis]
MSASPVARQACSHAQTIPSKRVLVTDASQLPDVYSSTPGGTLFSTTPGGTRIIYDRAFLMNLKNSPLSRTPPKNLPPALMKGSPTQKSGPWKAPASGPRRASNDQAARQHDNEHQFDMDI